MTPKTPADTFPDAQAAWDLEEASYRLRRLSGLRQQLAAAEQARADARSAYAKAIVEEKRLRAELMAALERETQPDLFSASRQAEDDHEEVDGNSHTPSPPEGHPWPEWLTEDALQAASIGPKLTKTPTKPASVRPIHWDSFLWVYTGGLWATQPGDWDQAWLLPLASEEDFRERWPGIGLKLAPALPAEPTEEDRLNAYAGVRVKAGRREMVVMPASEGRTVVRKKEG